MDELQFDELDFPLGWCAHCRRDVLAGAAVADGPPACVHCGAPITGSLRHARGMDLGDKGYALVEEQGCGRPDCGGGRCGSRS